jgi:hypothetical protein
MPLYDFECPHGHRFEKTVPMSECDKPIPCEGEVPQIQLVDAPDIGELPVKTVPCVLMATTVIAHQNPAGMLDHGSSNNRDAAREGRYDPLNPSRRFMAKGRGYRK